MKKFFYIIITIMLFCISCSEYRKQPCHTKYYPQPKISEDSIRVISEEEENKWLDSMTAGGEAVIVRGSSREYDTIIDHIRYRHIKEE